jgi:hypothetical protein
VLLFSWLAIDFLRKIFISANIDPPHHSHNILGIPPEGMEDYVPLPPHSPEDSLEQREVQDNVASQAESSSTLECFRIIFYSLEAS